MQVVGPRGSFRVLVVGRASRGVGRDGGWEREDGMGEMEDGERGWGDGGDGGWGEGKARSTK